MIGRRAGRPGHTSRRIALLPASCAITLPSSRMSKSKSFDKPVQAPTQYWRRRTPDALPRPLENIEVDVRVAVRAERKSAWPSALFAAVPPVLVDASFALSQVDQNHTGRLRTGMDKRHWLLLDGAHP